MRKFFLLTVLSVLWMLPTVAQTLGVQSTTRALVIGISDYQDDKITDLKFAHRDAQAFINFLKSNSGGNVPDENIQLLTNEAATTGKINSALNWLMEESNENDKVIIYFSGHGDVETITVRQRGYLLAHDTPPNNYRTLAIRLEDLNDVIVTLSQRNKSQITLITDACHSGNLAGNNINGKNATANELMIAFANEVKIMSCQPDELSLEGVQWGTGRGLFSYHLIEGLVGLADKDSDFQVDLREIERYLEDHVTREAYPNSQNPTTVGNPKTLLSLVDGDALSDLRKKKEFESESLDMVTSKVSKADLLAVADSGVVELYAAFEESLDEKYFLPSDLKGNRQPGKSASELYDVLSKKEELKAVHNLMKRNFAAALQDESQQAIIAYLKAEQEEVYKRNEVAISNYENHPVYLSKSAELLGVDHYLYDDLLAKQFYFEGLILRLSGIKNNEPALFDTALAKVNLALKYDNQAAYIFNELGMIMQAKKDFEGSISYFEKAMTLSPTWVLPPINLLISYRVLGQYNKAEIMGQKATLLQPDYYDIYRLRGFNFSTEGKKEKAIKMYLKALEYNPEDLWINNNLGALYLHQKNYEKARKYLEKTISIDSTYFWGQFNMGDYFAFTGKYENAVGYYKKAIGLKPLQKGPYVSLAYQYMYLGQFEAAKSTLEQVNTIYPEDVEYYFGLACYNALRGETEEGLRELERAIEKGLEYNRLKDQDINALKETTEYRNLVRKYYPDK